ncbi:MAG: hypothetical protein ACLR4A_19550 [Christensenellales bacterium]
MKTKMKVAVCTLLLHDDGLRRGECRGRNNEQHEQRAAADAAEPDEEQKEEGAQ